MNLVQTPMSSLVRSHQSTASITALTLVLALLITAVPADTVAADWVKTPDPISVYGDSTSYGIYRKGKRIGTHTLAFEQTGDQLNVAVASDLTVRILKIPVYRFKYRSDELWENGQLVSVNANVEEKGETRSVTLRREADQMKLTDNQGSTSTANLSFSSNHWHPGVLQSDAIFNTLTGKANNITIENLGVDTLRINNQDVDATHYRYTGQLQTEVWYDTRQRWVKLRFSGSDGSIIEYRSDGFDS